jgi:hypothetical protein
MRATYTARCGDKKTDAEMKALMDAESWFTAKEAIELGFVDDISIGDGEENAKLQKSAFSLINGFGEAFGRFGYKNVPESLKASASAPVPDREKQKALLASAAGARAGAAAQTCKLVKLAKRSAEKGLVYGIVYEPWALDTDTDYTSEEEIEKAAHNFLPDAVLNLRHTDDGDLDIDDVQVVESYIAPCSFFSGDQLIVKGSWVLVTRIKNQELLEAINNGEINGYSLQGTANKT